MCKCNDIDRNTWRYLLAGSRSLGQGQVVTCHWLVFKNGLRAHCSRLADSLWIDSRAVCPDLSNRDWLPAHAAKLRLTQD